MTPEFDTSQRAGSEVFTSPQRNRAKTVRSDAADICARRRSWEGLPYPESQYPPGSDEGEVEGVDLALWDGDVAYILYEFCSNGRLRDDSKVMFAHAIAGMAVALPHLSGPGREYFAAAYGMLQSIETSLGPTQ